MRSTADVQSRLKELHFFPYMVDGIEGPHIHSAIRNYQISIGLPASGVLTTATEARLFPPPPGFSKLGIVLTLLSIYHDLKKGTFKMGNYSKFIASIVGSLVAAGALWLANKGLATCTTVGDAQTCSVLGISTGQFNTAVMAVISAAFVWAFPPNSKA